MGLRLKAKIRWRDSLARLGGDEFGVCTFTLDPAVDEDEFSQGKTSFENAL